MENTTHAKKQACILKKSVRSAFLVFILCSFGLYSCTSISGSDTSSSVDQAITDIYSTITMEAAIYDRYIELTQQAPTSKPLPTETLVSIATNTLPPVPTNTLAPSSTPFPTNTPIPILPTQPPAPPQTSVQCDCYRDYDCCDFTTHSQAQACYESCGGNNWSGLDRDEDGIACESLP